MKKKLLVSVLGLGISALSLQATAAPCSSYASSIFTVQEGSTVCFVYDPTAVSPLYGNLTVSGDNIFATPVGFTASSTDGGTTSITGNGTIRVIAKDGYNLDAINVGELGNYRMSSGNTSVDVDASLRVFDWSSPIFGDSLTQSMTVSDLSLRDGNIHSWNASTGFDLNASILSDYNDLGLSLTNILTASTLNLGESAMITKTASGTHITVSIMTTPIPVPAAAWLFGTGLIALAGIARRKH